VIASGTSKASRVKLLLLGGTGNLSTDVARLATEEGRSVTVLVRGTREARLPSSVARVTGDATDSTTLASLARRGFDVVVDFVAYGADDVGRDVAAFRGKVGQYVFISSASVYRKPPPHYLVTEETPLGNPYWEYARRKIEAEEALRAAHLQEGFPVTIVRPSYTYGESWVPTTSGTDYTVVHRLRRGLPIVVPGDGTSLFVLTHARDFARGLLGLLGRREAIGEAFHITSDEVQTWNQVHETIARVLGVEPRLVHVPTDFIARIDARRGASLLGDKAWSLVFDNSKLRRLVPGFRAQVPFDEGVRASIEWLEADPSRQRLDANETVERILAAWEKAMGAAWPGQP
jgi:nucleoside-diphosphate-sugar epimerase